MMDHTHGLKSRFRFKQYKGIAEPHHSLSCTVVPLPFTVYKLKTQVHVRSVLSRAGENPNKTNIIEKRLHDSLCVQSASGIWVATS